LVHFDPSFVKVFGTYPLMGGEDDDDDGGSCGVTFALKIEQK